MKEGIFLSLGANIGNPLAQLKQATEAIEHHLGAVVESSRYYLTEPWGNPDQDDFYNQVIKVDTKLNPLAVLQHALQIEKNMGRKRTEDWGPRVIDIDVLFYNQLVIDSDILKIPHPNLHNRNFILIPFLDIAPEFIHPIFKISIEELYQQSTDEQEVMLVEA